MVGSCGLEPQTSTVSKRRDYVSLIISNNLEGVGDCLSTLNYGYDGILTGEITGEEIPE